jgi:hypothetical protein
MFRQFNRKPVDGIDMLTRRERTRLWYREQPVPAETISPLDALAQGKPVSAVHITRPEAAPRSIGTDRLVRESVSLKENLRKALGEAGDGAKQAPAPQAGAALTTWRDAPTHCPVLLLSATALLDARNPGPILGPGTRYRILSLHDGIAALEVTALDGQVGAGFCNAVDLTCVEPNLAHLRRESGAKGRQTARLSLNRLSQRISGVTAALVG